MPISVSKTKPKSLSKVLIYDEINEWVIGYYDKKSGRFIGSVDGARIVSPRCWRPLPESPKDDQDQQLAFSDEGYFLNQ